MEGLARGVETSSKWLRSGWWARLSVRDDNAHGAGSPVDAVIEQLDPYLGHGDIIIDGGNSHFGIPLTVLRRLRPLAFAISGGRVRRRRGLLAPDNA